MIPKKIQLDNIKIFRNQDHDIIEIVFYNIEPNEDHIFVVPEPLFYIESLNFSEEIEYYVNHFSVHYIIFKSSEEIKNLRLEINCKLKYQNKKLIENLDEPIDSFNVLPKCSIENILRINNFESQNTSGSYPYTLNFLVENQNDFEKVLKAYNNLPTSKINILNCKNFEIFPAKSSSDLINISKRINFKSEYLTQELDFHDNYPAIDIYIYFDNSKIRPIEKSSRLILNFANITELKNQISNFQTLKLLPKEDEVQHFAKIRSSNIFESYNSNFDYFLPFFNLDDSLLLRLKKKFEDRSINKDGEFTYEFKTYCFDYGLGNLAEEKFSGFFNEIFKNSFLKDPKHSLVCFGVEYYKNGTAKDISSKNLILQNSELVEKLKQKLFSTKLSEYKSNYYVIYFFESYFKGE